MESGMYLDQLPSELIVIISSYLDGPSIRSFFNSLHKYQPLTSFEIFDKEEKLYEELVKWRFPQEYLNIRNNLNRHYILWKYSYEDLIRYTI